MKRVEQSNQIALRRIKPRSYAIAAINKPCGASGRCAEGLIGSGGESLALAKCNSNDEI
jgi:hypothetical protein